MRKNLLRSLEKNIKASGDRLANRDLPHLCTLLRIGIRIRMGIDMGARAIESRDNNISSQAIYRAGYGWLLLLSLSFSLFTSSSSSSSSSPPPPTIPSRRDSCHDPSTLSFCISICLPLCLHPSLVLSFPPILSRSLMPFQLFLRVFAVNRRFSFCGLSRSTSIYALLCLQSRWICIKCLHVLKAL
jgi:hypothetical protein